MKVKRGAKKRLVYFLSPMTPIYSLGTRAYPNLSTAILAGIKCQTC